MKTCEEYVLNRLRVLEEEELAKKDNEIAQLKAEIESTGDELIMSNAQTREIKKFVEEHFKIETIDTTATSYASGNRHAIVFLPDTDQSWRITIAWDTYDKKVYNAFVRLFDLDELKKQESTSNE